MISLPAIRAWKDESFVVAVDEMLFGMAIEAGRGLFI
jgi:hypothetical protein